MKILIYTASAGNGHNSAANRIKETFLSHDPTNEIIIIDGFKKYNSKLKNWIQTKGYLWICNHGVKIYNYFFKKNETTDFSQPEKNSVHRIAKSMKKEMYKDILDIKPDLIISTYIYCSVALSDLKQEKNLDIKTASLMLDYGISPFWECIAKNTEYMFLTNDEYIKPFIERGFKQENLFPTGIPVSSTFSNLPSREDACKQLNIDPNMFTLTIMKAGFFGIKEKDIVKNIAKIEKPIQIVIINGKAKKSQQKLDSLLKKYKLKHKIYNIGFTKEIPLYFASSDLVLGKAGGLTTTETLTSCLPSLIVDNLPQQEIYNKEYMINHNCALGVTKNDISTVINELVNNPSILESMKDSCNNLRLTYSTEKMYEVLTKKV